MKKILIAILCLTALATQVSAQAINVSKFVQPDDVIVGDEILVTIEIQSNISQKLLIIEKMPEAFDVVSYDSRLTCSQELQPLTNTRIINCEWDAKRADAIAYKIVAREGGVYPLPEVIVVTEKDEEVRSSSNIAILVGIPQNLLITTAPPPITPPPEDEFPLFKFIRGAITAVSNFITTVFPESVRFFVLGLILFLALVLIIITPFYIFLGRYQEEE